MNSKTKSILFLSIIVALMVIGFLYQQNQKNGELTLGETSAISTATAQPNTAPSEATPNAWPAAGNPSPSISSNPGVSTNSMTTTTNNQPDLTVDANGLSKATVVMTTTQGVIKYKFYPKDAPATVNRIIELINKGFYNGLTFHRVVPGFVIQGGDPQGTGVGGSGQKLKAEFNTRRHIEGTVAMARSQDPDSADSQFYISLGTHPHLDRSYTVFGQLIEGMDVAKKIKVGDKMTTVTVE